MVSEIHETIPDYLAVAIEDYHVVDGSHAVNLIVDTLVGHLPENCRLLISSCSIPTLTSQGLALLTAGQEIAGLGVEDLRFSTSEIQALLEQNYGQRFSGEAAQQIAAQSGGWIGVTWATTIPRRFWATGSGT